METNEKMNGASGEEQTLPPLSRSSRFNILLMKRTNRLAIFTFVAGILYKVIEHYFIKN